MAEKVEASTTEKASEVPCPNNLAEELHNRTFWDSTSASSLEAHTREAEAVLNHNKLEPAGHHTKEDGTNNTKEDGNHNVQADNP